MDKKLEDIKPKKESVDADGKKFDFSPLDFTDRAIITSDLPGRALPKGIVWGVFFLIVSFVLSLVFFFHAAPKRAADSVAMNTAQIQSGISDLKDFNAKSAEEKFSAVSGNLGNFGIIGKLGYLFGGTADLFSGIQNLVGKGVILAQEAGFLENNGLRLATDKKGSEILAHLETIRKTIKDINTESEKLSASTDGFRAVNLLPVNFYVPIRLELGRLDKFLTVLTRRLNSEKPFRIVLLFQNPSEIRPAGGFLGSYAELTLNKGNIDGIKMHDVNDADRRFPLKIIPPRQLQASIIGWRTADANWFLDFEKSGGKVLQFLENSELYKKEGVNFDAAIAVSPKIIEDILGVIGPVRLNSGTVEINSENFLTELQKMVQEGQATRATYPKRALESLSKELLSRITAAESGKGNGIFSKAQDWVVKKDIIFYFKDRDLENFVDGHGAGGKIYALPADFNGDYFSLADANVGGGKSDIFIEQGVSLNVQINVDGTVSDHLVINRKHNGNKGRYWWYKVPNGHYLQIFVPPGSQITNFKGGKEKRIFGKINYAANGYVADRDISAIEGTMEKLFGYPAVEKHEESGKRVFSAWSTIKTGEKAEIVFDYTHRANLPPADGVNYQFVFDKQPGTKRDYKFEIGAPVGFIFLENNLPVYTYETADPPGRVILNLTLKKI